MILIWESKSEINGAGARRKLSQVVHFLKNCKKELQSTIEYMIDKYVWRSTRVGKAGLTRQVGGVGGLAYCRMNCRRTKVEVGHSCFWAENVGGVSSKLWLPLATSRGVVYVASADGHK